MKNNEMYECVEVCPHCSGENIMLWNTDTMGFVVKCNHCGEEILLCDDCLHREDNCSPHYCDWHETDNGGKCFRGTTVNCNIK